MRRTGENDGDFKEISEWLRSERPPFGEEDRAAMRRAVWREIEAQGRAPRGFVFRFRTTRIALAGAGALLAAVLAAVLWLRPIPVAPDGPAAATVLPDPAKRPAPAPAPEAVQRESVEASLAPPATGRSRPSLRTRRTEPRGVPVRIEFQTANPEVRIIWFVKKGEAAPRLLPAGHQQEVS